MSDFIEVVTYRPGPVKLEFDNEFEGVLALTENTCVDWVEVQS